MFGINFWESNIEKRSVSMCANDILYKFNSEATPQFTGLYRIVRTESNFDQGQFTQTLTMARCNNQKKVSANLKWSGSKSSESTPQTDNVFDIGAA